MIRISSSQYDQGINPSDDPKELFDLLQKELQNITDLGDDARKEFAARFERVVTLSNDSALKASAKACVKWLKYTSFDPSLIASDLPSISFIAGTGLIHTMMLYVASSDMLEGDPITVRNINGCAHIKKDGVWTAVNELGIKPLFDQKGQFLKFDGWTFVHPNGFIPQDISRWENIKEFPIAILKPEKLAEIRHKARARDDQPYILQPIVTDEGAIPDFRLLSNLRNMMGKHVHALIIDKKGQIFSVGIMFEDDEMQFLIGGLKTVLGSTANAKIYGVDYDLSRTKCTHHTTFIPMNARQANKAFAYINSTNAGEGLRMNFIRQNCARFVLGLLHTVGHAPNIQVSAKTMIWGMLPSFQDMPLIGKPMQLVAQKIAKLTKPIFDESKRIWRRSPLWVRKSYKTLREVMWYVPNRLGTFFISLAALLLLGGTRGSDMIAPPQGSAVDNERKLANFQRLFDSFGDLFDEKRTTSYAPFKLIEWMKDKTGSAYTIIDNRAKAVLPI